MENNIIVTTRMYRVGELGDCFHLNFKAGESESNVLIDCGSFRNSVKSKGRLRKIVSHLKNELQGKKLDLVVGTHQHNDHVSGFVHCEDLFTGSVKKVWLSWLDNPKDSFARQIKNDQKQLQLQLQAISKKLAVFNKNQSSEVVNDILGFYAAAGDEPEIPAKGIEILKSIGEDGPEYLSPGQIVDLPGMLPAGEVKVYVLGPPRRQSQLFDKDPSKEETYDPHLVMANTFARKFLSAIENNATVSDSREEEYFPFSKIYKIKSNAKVNAEILKRYNSRKESYRKIDTEWLKQAERLALYLDTYTNNSSLVLAFELVKSGKFLLFAADAQTGNWSSWEKVKWKEPREDFSVQQLLENTVLYKVGHHGSHNATLKAAMELMEHEELTAMIPVDKSDANIKKPNGWKMPAKNLYKVLKQKTKFRVLRMDTGFADDCPKEKWKKLPFKPRVDDANDLVEYKIQG